MAVIGTTGFVIYTTICYPGVWNFIIMLGLSWINYLIFDSMVNIVLRIRKRKRRMHKP